MDLLSALLAISVSAAASVVSSAIFKYLKRNRDDEIEIKLPDGTEYKVPVSKDSREELEQRLQSFIYLGSEPVEVNPSYVSIKEDVIDSITKTISHLLNKQSKSIQLTGFEHIPKIYIDRKFIELALFNIIINAVKYSRPDSTIIISASKNEDIVEVTITNYVDSAIKPDEVNKLFQLGFRGSNAIIKESSGSGLGLFVANKILKKLDANVSADSFNDKFSISIRIPIKTAK